MVDRSLCQSPATKRGRRRCTHRVTESGRFPQSISGRSGFASKQFIDIAAKLFRLIAFTLFVVRSLFLIPPSHDDEEEEEEEEEECGTRADRVNSRFIA